MSSEWLLYGAYGHAGAQIAEAAVRRGHQPLLAGRDPVRLRAVADRLGLDAVPLALEDPQALAAAVSGRRLVLAAAGPFSETGAPLLEACLGAGAHYLDVSGEIHHLRRVLALDPRAEAAGVMLLTGGGFGVTYGDGLARHVMDRLPGAERLRVSISAANAFTTDGVRRTIQAVIAGGGFAVEGGAWTPRPIGHENWTLEDRGESIGFIAVPMGELAALAAWAKAQNILVGRPLPPPVTAGDDAPAAAPAGGWRSWLVAEAWGARGERVAARLETGEGGAATATAALANLEAQLANPRPGAFTPARAFGADHVCRIEGVTLVDLDNDP